MASELHDSCSPDGRRLQVAARDETSAFATPMRTTPPPPSNTPLTCHHVGDQCIAPPGTPRELFAPAPAPHEQDEDVLENPRVLDELEQPSPPRPSVPATNKPSNKQAAAAPSNGGGGTLTLLEMELPVPLRPHLDPRQQHQQQTQHKPPAGNPSPPNPRRGAAYVPANRAALRSWLRTPDRCAAGTATEAAVTTWHGEPQPSGLHLQAKLPRQQQPPHLVVQVSRAARAVALHEAWMHTHSRQHARRDAAAQARARHYYGGGGGGAYVDAVTTTSQHDRRVQATPETNSAVHEGCGLAKARATIANAGGGDASSGSFCVLGLHLGVPLAMPQVAWRTPPIAPPRRKASAAAAADQQSAAAAAAAMSRTVLAGLEAGLASSASAGSVLVLSPRHESEQGWLVPPRRCGPNDRGAAAAMLAPPASHFHGPSSTAAGRTHHPQRHGAARAASAGVRRPARCAGGVAGGVASTLAAHGRPWSAVSSRAASPLMMLVQGA